MGLLYTPPNGNNLNFELRDTEYVTPDGDAVNFWMAYDQSGLVRVFLSQLYSLRTSANFLQPYNIYSAHLAVGLSQIYGLRTSVNLLQWYSDAAKPVQWLEQWYGDARKLNKVLIQSYNDAYRVKNMVVQPYSLPTFLTQRLEQQYALTGVALLTFLQQAYDISTLALVKVQLQQPFSLLDEINQVIPPETGDGIIVTPIDPVNGGVIVGAEVDLGYFHINIESGSDQYCMSCEAHLRDQAHYTQVNILDNLSITIGGETFEFFVESKQRRRGFGKAEYSIQGLSKTALLDAPYAEEVTDDELSGMASVIVSALAPDYTINWNTVDWFIPTDTLLPAGETPLAIIKNIAQAAGAIVQTEPDGTMTIEPLWPIPIPNWSTSVPDYILSDALNFFSTGETYEHKPGYNKYLITSASTGNTGVRFEEETLTETTKYVRAYQIPWTGIFDIDHTGCSWVILSNEGVEVRDVEDEIVEIVEGVGTTQYPIYGIVSYGPQNDEGYEKECFPLGTLDFEEDGTLTFSVDHERLIKITYQTKCQKYLVTDPKDEQVQIIAEVL